MPKISDILTHRRKALPSLQRAWLEEQQDAVAEFEDQFAEWLKGLSGFGKAAESRLYENQDFQPIDLRFHRAALGGLICDGEGLAIEILRLFQQGLVVKFNAMLT